MAPSAVQNDSLPITTDLPLPSRSANSGVVASPRFAPDAESLNSIWREHILGAGQTVSGYTSRLPLLTWLVYEPPGIVLLPVGLPFHGVGRTLNEAESDLLTGMVGLYSRLSVLDNMSEHLRLTQQFLEDFFVLSESLD